MKKIITLAALLISAQSFGQKVISVNQTGGQTGAVIVNDGVVTHGDKVIYNGKDAKKYITIIIKGDARDVKCDACNEIRVTGNASKVESQSGNITANEIKGDAETMSGDIRSTTIHGDARTMSGDIESH